MTTAPRVPLPCLHLGPPVPPPDSSCPRLCRHWCRSFDQAVRPAINCGPACKRYDPDEERGEEKQPA